MPLLNLAFALMVVGMALWLIQSLYDHQHQDDSERRRCGCRWDLGVAGSGIVGEIASYGIR